MNSLRLLKAASRLHGSDEYAPLDPLCQFRFSSPHAPAPSPSSP